MLPCGTPEITGRVVELRYTHAGIWWTEIHETISTRFPLYQSSPTSAGVLQS